MKRSGFTEQGLLRNKLLASWRSMSGNVAGAGQRIPLFGVPHVRPPPIFHCLPWLGTASPSTSPSKGRAGTARARSTAGACTSTSTSTA